MEWDFSDNDLSDSIYFSQITNSNSVFKTPIQTKIVKKDESTAYAFILNRTGNNISRLQISENTTTINDNDIVDIKDLDGNVKNADDFIIHKEGDTYYILVLNTTEGSLVLGTFGNSLDNIPTFVSTVATGFVTARRMVFTQNSTNKYIVVANSGNNQISILNFRETITNSINPNTQILNYNTNIPGLLGISISHYCDKWSMFISSTSSKNNT